MMHLRLSEPLIRLILLKLLIIRIGLYYWLFFSMNHTLLEHVQDGFFSVLIANSFVKNCKDNAQKLLKT